jgi:pimeloyl-ACP methyl ester carboxylesterase
MEDAQRRFHIDTDRVFLSGHGMGADAAFDLGMSHPDLFAGVIPISGYCDKYCKWYWKNGRQLPWYVVRGELDLRPSWEANLVNINRMLKLGFDMIYLEHIGRGYESYYSEIHKLFDWMEPLRRNPAPKEFEMDVLRPSEDRFYWVDMDGVPESVSNSQVLVDNPADRGRIRPMSLKANITDGGEDRATIYVKSGAARHVLYLSPDLVDFNRRVTIIVNGRRRFNEFLQADAATMLEDLRQRGDRQRLRWVRIELN